MMEKKRTRKQMDWQQFFITVVGTAIGVALTFIVSGILERRNKAHAQRLTAIMVIHDIDNSIDVLKDMREKEEQNGELLRLALKQRDHLELVPFDTLYNILNLLTDSQLDFRFDTSKEKIFNSDLDTWQNLGNMAFLDNVQGVYHTRQDIQVALNQSAIWKSPISDEEYLQIIMRGRWVSTEEFSDAIVPFLKEKLYDNQVVYFINTSSHRDQYLTEWIDYWTRVNDLNKFLMGITDRELEDYISSISKKGIPLTKSKLLGHWGFTAGGQDCEYDFHGDRSYEYVIVYAPSFVQTMYYSGKLRITLSYRGEWSFQGDSLVLDPDFSTTDMTLDTSGLVPEENMKDSMDVALNRYREEQLAYSRELAEKGETYTYKPRMDSSNDKMEWTRSDGDVRYLKRIRE